MLTQTCVLCSAEGDAGAQAMEGDFDASRATMRRHVHRKVGSGLHMPPPSEHPFGSNGGAQAKPCQRTMVSTILGACRNRQGCRHSRCSMLSSAQLAEPARGNLSGRGYCGIAQGRPWCKLGVQQVV